MRPSIKLTSALAILAIALAAPAAAADAAFTQWLGTLWPQAQGMGISRATFDLATRGLEPDLTLPDLDLPPKPGTKPPSQAEFVETPADYIRESSIARLAEDGRKLATQYRATLVAMERAV